MLNRLAMSCVDKPSDLNCSTFLTKASRSRSYDNRFRSFRMVTGTGIEPAHSGFQADTLPFELPSRSADPWFRTRLYTFSACRFHQISLVGKNSDVTITNVHDAF